MKIDKRLLNDFNMDEKIKDLEKNNAKEILITILQISSENLANAFYPQFNFKSNDVRFCQINSQIQY